MCYLVVAPDSDYLFILSSTEHARIRLDNAPALKIPPTAGSSQKTDAR